LLIYIPCLVFDSSYHINWHTFRREFWQIIILAGPGIVVSAILTAVTILYILGYEGIFDWSSAMMLGSVLAATDPVAVVALLKEVGASRRLATMIEGESLLNDGTAMVLFAGMLGLAVEGSINIGELIGLFVRLAIGGPLVGILCGMVVSFLLLRVYHDEVLEFSLTFMTAYFTFFIAEETEVKVSGILAICGLGLYMSAWGKHSITSQSEESVHHVWGYVAYASETMIFCMSGVIIGHKVIMGEIVEGKDYGLLILFYVCMYLIRMIFLGMFYPVLKYYAYGVTWRDAIIIVHGGMLRGALGLILALIISVEDELDEKVRHLSLFHMAGIAVLTLVINAPTTGPLLKGLGLADTSKVQETVIQEVLFKISQETHEKTDELKRAKNLKEADWKKVKKITNLNVFISRVLSSTTGGQRLLKQLKGDLDDPRKFIEAFKYALNISDSSELEKEHRIRFLQTLKSMYIHSHEEGTCTSEAVNILVESAETALDHEDKELSDWKTIRQTMKRGLLMKIYMKLKGAKIVGRFFMNLAYRRLALYYDVAHTFLECHHTTREKIKETIRTEEWIVLEKVIKESLKESKKCKKFVNKHITGIFAEISSDIQTKKAARTILNTQLEVVNGFLSSGIINDKEFNMMKSLLENSMYKLQTSGNVSDIPELSAVIHKIPFFETFDDESIQQLTENAETVLMREGEMLFKRGEPALGIYIILRGSVKEINDTELEFEHESGSIVGLHHLISSVDDNLTSCIAQTIVYAAFIPKFKLQETLHNPMIEERLWKIATPFLISLNVEKFDAVISSLDFEKLKQLMEFCVFSKYDKSQTVNVDTPLLLLSGAVIFVDYETTRRERYNKLQVVNSDLDNGRINRESEGVYSSMMYINRMPGALVLSIEHATVALHFNEELNEAVKEKGMGLNQAIEKMYQNLMEAIELNAGLRRTTTVLAPVIMRRKGQGKRRIRKQVIPNGPDDIGREHSNESLILSSSP
jgi:NhaP-type Na+/H+ or K+/H+ antiporter